jgi:hypothetical protein
MAAVIAIATTAEVPMVLLAEKICDFMLKLLSCAWLSLCGHQCSWAGADSSLPGGSDQAHHRTP